MLGKLLKYDLRSTFRIFPIMIMGVAGMYMLGLVSKALKISQMVGTFTAFLTIFAVATLIVSQVVMVVRFYKGMFGTQGYLTQTLPVSPGSHIISKLIAGILMMLACIVLAGLAVLGILHMNGVDIDLSAFFEFINVFFGSGFEPLAIFYIVTFIISFFLFVAEVYFAIALAHTRPFIKNSVVFSVVLYFAINTVVGIIDAIAMLFIPLGLKISETGVSWTASGSLGSLVSSFMIGAADGTGVYEFTLGAGSMLTQIATTVGLLLLTKWLLNNKTSLK